MPAAARDRPGDRARHARPAAARGRVRPLDLRGRAGAAGSTCAPPRRAPTSRSSRAPQARAAAELRRAIPQATVSRRLRVILDALTVELPVGELPQLYRLGFVNKVYPSMRFTLNLDNSPSLIGATAFSNATGARGRGRQDRRRRRRHRPDEHVLRPDRLHATRPGSRKGQTAYTTPKVIVARAYPGPGSGKAGRLPLDRKASFHGTHVAGIAAGDAGTTAPAGPDHPEVKNLSGVAPRAWLGSYRVFNVPDPGRQQRLHASDRRRVRGRGRRRHGRDQLLRRRADERPGQRRARRGGPQRRRGGRRTRDLGRQRPRRLRPRQRRRAGDGARRDQRRRGLEHPRLRPGDQRLGAGRAPADPVQPRREHDTAAWGTIDQKLVDVGTIVGTDGKPVDRYLCGPGGNVEAAQSTLPRRLADRRDRARLARLLLVRLQGPPREGGRRGGDRVRRQPPRRGERRTARRRHAGRDDRRRRRGALALGPGERRAGDSARRAGSARDRDRPRRHADELLLRRADALRTRPQAGRLGARRERFSPRRCARRSGSRSPSSTAPAWRRRTSQARPHCSSSGIRAGARSRSSPR